VATYAKRDAVDVRLTAKAPTLDEARAQVEALEARARDRLGLHVFGTDGDTPQSVLSALLIDRGWSLATMESCTGGLLASLLTDVPGVSAIYLGGLVSYSAALKTEWGVLQDVLDAHGTVSEETARAMAQAVRRRLGADVGIAVTGVAGPDAVEGKPVGLVHLAVTTPHGERHSEQRIRGNRAEVKWRAAIAAVHLARLALLRDLAGG
jgi:nicotinamide-nucleotide amidase